MTFHFFKRKSHSANYQKYMIREPEEVKRLILSYLHEKGNTFGLAIDLGCGTGASTRTLVPYFKTVVGVDISRTQIEEAERNGAFPNLSYIMASAEQLPFGDGTVDLVTASVAAHWFIMDKFLSEVDRVLKVRGCLALYCFDPFLELHYEGCSEILTAIFSETMEYLASNFAAGIADEMRREYKWIYDAAPFTDKKSSPQEGSKCIRNVYTAIFVSEFCPRKLRVTQMWLKHPLTVAELVGYFESNCTFQNFFSSDPERASRFLERLQDRWLVPLLSQRKDLIFEEKYHCSLQNLESHRDHMFGNEVRTAGELLLCAGLQVIKAARNIESFSLWWRTSYLKCKPDTRRPNCLQY